MVQSSTLPQPYILMVVIQSLLLPVIVPLWNIFDPLCGKTLAKPQHWQKLPSYSLPATGDRWSGGKTNRWSYSIFITTNIKDCYLVILLHFPRPVTLPFLHDYFTFFPSTPYISYYSLLDEDCIYFTKNIEAIIKVSKCPPLHLPIYRHLYPHTLPLILLS